MGGGLVGSPAPICLCSPYRELPKPGTAVHSFPAVPCRVSETQEGYGTPTGWRAGGLANDTADLPVDNQIPVLFLQNIMHLG